MKLPTLAFVIALSLGTAFAGGGGSWTEKISYQTSAATSVKVDGPTGFKVTVGDRKGTVPEIFTVANADAFVPVTIEAPDGTVWSSKVEVRAKQQVHVNLTFTAAKETRKKPAPAPAKPARNHMGRFVHGGKGCGKAWDRPIKAELRHPDGDAVKATVELTPGEYKDVEVAAGTYEVRVSYKDGAAWKFALTEKHEVTKDGWALGFGCKPGSKTPVLVGK